MNWRTFLFFRERDGPSSNSFKSFGFPPKPRRRAAFQQDGVFDAVFAERRRQRRAAKTAILEDPRAKPRQFVPAVVGGVGCGDQHRRPVLRERLPGLVKAERRLADPSRKAERVERPPFKAGVDAVDQLFRRARGRLEGARKESLGNCALERRSIRRDPGAAPAEFFRKVGRDDAVRAQRKADQPRGRRRAAAGDAGPRPVVGRLMARVDQRRPPLAQRRLRPRLSRDLLRSPSRRRRARA